MGYRDLQGDRFRDRRRPRLLRERQVPVVLPGQDDTGAELPDGQGHVRLPGVEDILLRRVHPVNGADIASAMPKVPDLAGAPQWFQWAHLRSDNVTMMS